MPNTLVINFGDMLARITGNQLKSTKHRVLDIGVERYSSPFFFEPFYGAKIPTSIIETYVDNDSEPFTYGEYVTEKMRSFGEFKDFGKTNKS